MVWNSTQSSLYQAVNKHNNSVRTFSEPHIPPEPEKKAPEPEKKPCSSCQSNPAKSIPDMLAPNSDFFLIAALIFILSKENADKSLILALVLILLQ